MKKSIPTKPHVATLGGIKGVCPITVRAARSGPMSVSHAVMNTVSFEPSAPSLSGAISAALESDPMSESLNFQEPLERMVSTPSSCVTVSPLQSARRFRRRTKRRRRKLPDEGCSMVQATNGIHAGPVASNCFSGPQVQTTKLITITREQILNFDFSPILSRLKKDVLPTGHQLGAMMGTFKCRIVGYHSNTLFQRTTREYFHKLDKVWPYWAYFFEIDCMIRFVNLKLTGGLAWTSIDVLSSILGIAAWRINGGPYRRLQKIPQEIVDKTLNRALHHLRVIASMTDLTELQVSHHCNLIFRAFKNNYEGPKNEDSVILDLL
jgi:hypothetical protein